MAFEHHEVAPVPTPHPTPRIASRPAHPSLEGPLG